jgi:hypothetical protein
LIQLEQLPVTTGGDGSRSCRPIHHICLLIHFVPADMSLPITKVASSDPTVDSPISSEWESAAMLVESQWAHLVHET